MSETIAEYLAHRAEPEATLAHRIAGTFGHALEIPAYGEEETLFNALASVPAGPEGDVLIVVVLNARGDSPASVHRANAAARTKLASLGSRTKISSHPDVHVSDHPHGKILVIDRGAAGAYLPRIQGIGLARKIGFDLVLALHALGRIASPWIHATDADVRLPADYFEQVAAIDTTVTGAALYFFRHLFPGDEEVARAGRLYEISLRYDTLGLAWAGSPYAYQNMGSCLAIPAAAYAAVGGFPMTNAIEDVTILNALAKIGRIERLGGAPVGLDGRTSTRVPVSTGQAVSAIVSKRGAADSFRLHHPLAFAHLAAWLRVLSAVARRGEDVPAALEILPLGSPFFRADVLEEALRDVDAFAAVRDAIREPGDERERLLRLHRWFDGFRTRRLLESLRDSGLPALPYLQALSEAPFTGLTYETDLDLVEIGDTLAAEERRLSASPAGVPSLEPEGA
ncbi:MAG: hypothetical protein M3542_11395 [Acidobacteriota bacterium]|nr:hypothetical protein [Acidobacteriota bacterium]MDQ5871747.1 hypothetical protein [Acidobacteriota bacterium]